MGIIAIIFGLVFFIPGAISLILDIKYRRRHKERLYSWRGVIAKRTDSDEIEFSYNVNGLEHLWKPGEDNAMYKINEISEELEILYNPSNPKEAAGLYLKLSTVIVGIVCVVIGAAIFYFGYWLPHTGVTMEMVNEPMLIILGGSVFAVSGVFLMAVAIRKLVPKRYKDVFTESTAVCVKHLVSRWDNDGGLAVLPVFEYTVNNVVYQMSGFSPRDKIYTNVGIVNVGESRQIWINPDNPRDAHIQRGESRFSMSFIMLAVMAAFFLIPGIFVMGVGFREVETFSIFLPLPPITSPAPYVPFEAVGSFNAGLYPDLMERFERDFAPYDGVILMEIYEEGLLAMLNDPTVSPLGRARENNFAVGYYNPVELYIIRFDGYEIIYMNTNMKLSMGSYHYLPLGHGVGVDFPARYVDAATDWWIAGAMRSRGYSETLYEAQIIVFDDPHLRYAPALFIWCSTPDGVFILWFPLDDLTDYMFLRYDFFVNNWRDFIRLL